MRLFQLFFLALAGTVITSACAGSSSKKNEEEKNDVEAYKLDSRPFVNDRNAEQHRFFFNVVDSHSTDSSVVYTALSLFEEDTLGFDLEVMKGIPAGVTMEGTPDQEKGFRVGSLKFISIGHVSDNLVKALQEIYNMEGTGEMRKDTISPMVFSSNVEAVDLDRGGSSTYSFKIFFDNKLGQEAEVFSELDLYRKSFELMEKDESFRANLLSALTGL